MNENVMTTGLEPVTDPVPENEALSPEDQFFLDLFDLNTKLVSAGSSVVGIISKMAKHQIGDF